MLKPIEVDEHLHFMLREHRNIMRQYFRGKGLFNGQPPMMFVIHEHPGLTQKELAEHMHITPASVAVSIRRMEAEGLVIRENDREDARVLHLTLTPEGERLHTACHGARDEMIASLYEGFTQEELMEFDQYIGRICQRLEQARSRFLTNSESQERTDTADENLG